MKKIKQPPQIELFPYRGNVHALGLLRWDDSLWTKPIEVKLLSGETLHTNLITIRRLKTVADQITTSKPPRETL